MLQPVRKPLAGDVPTSCVPKRKSQNVPPPLPSKAALSTNTPYCELVRRRRNYLEKKRIHARKDSIQAMHNTVRELEQKYEALCRIADTVRHERASSQQQTTTLVDQDQAQEHHELAKQGDDQTTSSASLYGVVQEIHFLIHDNTRLRELIEQQVHFQHGLRCIVEEEKLEQTITSTIQFDQYSKFCYVPFSTDECYSIIRKDLAQNVLANKPDFEDPRINQRLLFGWVGCVEIKAYDSRRLQAYTQMTKEWPGTPEHNCNTMWHFDIQETDPNHVYLEQHCLEILQHVTDDIKVARRRVAWQGCTSWSVYLTYRTRVGESYLIGCVPLPLWGNGSPTRVDDPYGEAFLNDTETMSLLPLFHLFVPVVKASGEVHTRLFRWGTAACQAQAFMSLFKQCALESLLRYEQLVLFPVVNLLQK